MCADPSGIRFGSGEIYAIVEAAPFNTLLSNTLCVGRRRPQDSDEEVFLFVVMNNPSQNHLTPNLRAELKKAIRQALSPRHVPKYVLEVPEIPVTINGKKVETAVKQVLSGKDVKASNTVLNPESIAYFKRFRDLEREPREGARL